MNRSLEALLPNDGDGGGISRRKPSNNRRDVESPSWCSKIRRSKKCRRCFTFIFLIILIPVVELLRRYHEEIWEYCPQANVYWAQDEVYQAKCEIPKLNLWDPTIKKYIDQEKPVKDCATGCFIYHVYFCFHFSFLLSDYPLIKLVWNSEGSYLELTEKGKSEMPSLDCYQQEVARNNDDKTLTYGKEIKVDKFPLKVPWEVIRIICKKQSEIYYTDVFGTIIPKTNKKQKNGYKKKQKQFSIMIVGIDSVSRQSFLRFLPKSFKWLKDRQDDGYHVFDAYHKIGENTFPNLVPMLTGRKVELSAPHEQLQLPHGGSFYTWVLQLPFDDFPFIWNDFSDQGYATAFIEDDPQIGTFNLMRAGFKNQPTDHYGRPLFLAFDDLKNRESEFNPGLMELNETSGQLQITESNYFCINGRKKFQLLWDLSVKQFTSRYAPTTPFFMLSWVVQLTHEWLTTLKQGDEPLVDLLEYMHNDENLSDTFVVVMSDHGQRVDSIRSSFVGRLEDRLPFLAIRIPPTFRQLYPEHSANLEMNSARLMTTLDLYATFKHILYLSTTDESQTLNKHPNDDGFSDVGPSGYANSLFREISETRSCAGAGVPEWYCACHQYVQLNDESEKAKKAANTVVEEIQKSVKNSSDLCKTPYLERIESVRQVKYAPSASHKSRCRFFGIIKDASNVEDVFDEFVIQLTTMPGNALFEATVRNYWMTKQGWQVLGNIERVNRYGNQPKCLPDSLEKIRKFCYCHNFSDT